MMSKKEKIDEAIEWDSFMNANPPERITNIEQRLCEALEMVVNSKCFELELFDEQLYLKIKRLLARVKEQNENPRSN